MTAPGGGALPGAEIAIVGPTRVAPRDVRAVAERVAALDRAAYTGSDPIAGLPPPDGALEDPAAVARELEEGMQVSFAIDRAGRDVGVLRMVERSPSRWMVLRMAVPRSSGGRGVSRLLFDHMESEGAARGVKTFYFHAVVERGRPQIWSPRGYRVVARWPSDDKPLTEVTMERDPAAPRAAVAFPWDGDDALPDGGIAVSWLAGGGEVTAVAEVFTHDAMRCIRDHHASADGRLHVGADVWPGAGHAELAELRRKLQAAGAEPSGPGRSGFRRPLDQVVSYVMPRTLEPRLLALWRFPQGVAAPPGRGPC